MARDVNKVMLIGRLGADPEMRYTPSGTAVTNLRLAVNRRVRGEEGQEPREDTEWVNVLAWDKLAETCSRFVSKGRRVYIEGRLRTRSYEAQDGCKRYVTEVVASDMIMLDGRGTQAVEASEPGEGDVPF